MNAAHLQEIINNYIDKFEITNGCILAQKEYQMTEVSDDWRNVLRC